MNRVTLESVIGKIHKLPSLPVVVIELLASLTQEDLDIDVLSKKITADQVLTAKALKVANSTFYGMPRQIATVTQAIAVLGFHTIRNLVTTSAMVNGMPASSQVGFDTIHFWRHSIATAVCANAIAAEVGEHKSEAYTVGLLHDIGRLVLATQFSAEYGQAIPRGQ
jgi:HD-like signal output (HDOD) protein